MVYLSKIHVTVNDVGRNEVYAILWFLSKLHMVDLVVDIEYVNADFRSNKI